MAGSITMGLNINAQLDGKLKTELESIQKTISIITRDKTLGKYWKTQEELIEDMTSAYNAFAENASRDTASEFIKSFSAITADAKLVQKTLGDLKINIDISSLENALNEARKLDPATGHTYDPEFFETFYRGLARLRDRGADVDLLVNSLGTSDKLQQYVNKSEELTWQLKAAKDEIEDLKMALADADSASGLDALRERLEEANFEIDRLNAQSERVRRFAKYEFQDFLNANDLDSDEEGKFKRTFDRIEQGGLTAKQAIAEIKNDYGYLLENSADIGTEQLQSFISKLEIACTQIEEMRTEIAGLTTQMQHIGETGALTSLTQSLTENEELTDAQRASMASLLADAQNLDSLSQVLTNIIRSSENADASVDQLYESMSHLVGSIQQLSSAEFANLESISNMFKSISNMNGLNIESSSLQALYNTIDKLNNLQSSGSLVMFSGLNFDGFNNLHVSKSSVANLIDLIEAVNGHNIGDLSSLSNLNFDWTKDLKISKASIDNLVTLFTALSSLDLSGLQHLSGLTFNNFNGLDIKKSAVSNLSELLTLLKDIEPEQLKAKLSALNPDEISGLSAEVDKVSELQQAISLVEDSVNKKTDAFDEEQLVVGQAVQNELVNLAKLKTSVDTIIESVNRLNETFAALRVPDLNGQLPDVPDTRRRRGNNGNGDNNHNDDTENQSGDIEAEISSITNDIGRDVRSISRHYDHENNLTRATVQQDTFNERRGTITRTITTDQEGNVIVTRDETSQSTSKSQDQLSRESHNQEKANLREIYKLRTKNLELANKETSSEEDRLNNIQQIQFNEEKIRGLRADNEELHNQRAQNQLNNPGYWRDVVDQERKLERSYRLVSDAYENSQGFRRDVQERKSDAQNTQAVTTDNYNQVKKNLQEIHKLEKENFELENERYNIKNTGKVSENEFTIRRLREETNALIAERELLGMSDANLQKQEDDLVASNEKALKDQRDAWQASLNTRVKLAEDAAYKEEAARTKAREKAQKENSKNEDTTKEQDNDDYYNSLKTLYKKRERLLNSYQKKGSLGRNDYSDLEQIRKDIKQEEEIENAALKSMRNRWDSRETNPFASAEEELKFKNDLIEREQQYENTLQYRRNAESDFVAKYNKSIDTTLEKAKELQKTYSSNDFINPSSYNKLNEFIETTENLRRKSFLGISDNDIASVHDISSLFKDIEKSIKNTNNLKANRKGTYLGTLTDFVDDDDRKSQIKSMIQADAEAHGKTMSNWKFGKNDTSATYDLITRDGLIEKMSVNYDTATKQLRTLKQTEQDYVSTGQQFINSLKGKFAEITRYISVMDVVQKAIQFVKEGMSAVIEIDTAMTELRKVTDETATSYDNFISKAQNIATTVGGTTKDIINSTAEYARLGYSLNEASTLATSSAIYTNVGDGIDMATATEDLVSIMQAYGKTADQSMEIVDTLNEVGNNFAISSSGIGEALKRSSSALAAGNNSFEESVAMAAAMNEVLQDTATTGTTLKMLSLRIRGASTEIVEMGESTDGMAESTSKLREQILALTNVDGKGGFDIMTNNGSEFKSTYSIMQGISKVWKDMNDIDQAALLELIAGKNRAQGAAALLTNFAQAENALEDAQNASGSAMEENEKYLDSIQGKITLLQAEFQNLWTNGIDTGFVKGLIDIGATLLKLADNFGLVKTAAAAALSVISLNGAGIFDFSKNKKYPDSPISDLWLDTFKGSSPKDIINKLWNGTGKQVITAEKLGTVEAADLLEEWKEASKNNISIDEFIQTNELLSQNAHNAQIFKSSLEEAEKSGVDLTAKKLAENTNEAAKAAEKYNNSFKNAGLKGVLKTLGRDLLGVGLNTAISFAASALISGIFKGLDYIVHYDDNLIKKGEEAMSNIANTYKEFSEGQSNLTDMGKSFADNTDEIKSTEDAIASISEKYEEYRKGVNHLTNENLSLTNDEYREYLELSNSLADQFPELISGYDAQGNAILNLGNNAAIATDRLNSLYLAQQASAHVEIGEQLGDTYRGIATKISQAERKKYGYTLEQDRLREDLAHYNALTLVDDKYGIGGISEDNLQRTQEILDKYGIGYTTTEIHPLFSKNSEYIIDIGVELDEDTVNSLNNELDFLLDEVLGKEKQQLTVDLNKVMQEENAQDLYIKDQWQSMIEPISNYLKTTGTFNNLNTDLQNAILGNLDKIDLDTLTQDYDGDWEAFLYSEFLAPLNTLTPEIQEALGEALTIDPDKTYADNFKGIKEKLRDIYGDDWGSFFTKFGFDKLEEEKNTKIRTISDMLIASGESRTSIGQFPESLSSGDLNIAYDLIVNDKFSGTFEQLEQAITRYKQSFTETESPDFATKFTSEDITAKVDSFQKSLSSLDTALESLKSNGRLDSSTLTDLYQEFPELAGQADHLQEAIGNLKFDKLKEFVNQWHNMMVGFTGEEAKKAQEVLDSIISGAELSDAELKYNNVLSNVLDSLDVPAEQGKIRNIFSDIWGDFSGTAEGREAIAKLSLDPESATWTYAQWKENVENLIPEIKLSLSEKNLASLQNALTDLQTSAQNMQDSLSFKESVGAKSLFSDYEGLVKNSRQQVKNLQEQNAELRKEQAGLEVTSEAYRNIESQINENVSAINSAYLNQLEWNNAADALRYEQNEGLLAYNKAKQTRNAGDNYLEMISAAEEAQEAWENGLIGTDDFKSVAKMFSPIGMDDATNWQENYGKITRYFTEDVSGVKNFLNDLSEKTNDAGEALATYNDQTGEWSYNIDNVKSSADELGISFESFLAVMGRLQDYGFTNDFFASVEEGQDHIGDLYYDLHEAESELKSLEQAKLEGDLSVTDSALSAQEAKVNQIKQSILESQDLLAQLAARSADEYAAERTSKIQSVLSMANTSQELDSGTAQGYLNSLRDQIISDTDLQIELADLITINDDGTLALNLEKYLELEGQYGISSLELSTEFQDAAVAGLQGKITELYNNEASEVKGIIDELGQYTNEQFSAITFGDGESINSAEVALDQLITSLGIGQEQGQMLLTILGELGYIDYGSKFQELHDKLSAEQKKIEEWGLTEFGNAFDQSGNSFVQTKFGNVDMDKRAIITWSDELKETYKDALESWDYTPDTGAVDTVFGMSQRFGEDTLKNGVEVAFTPIMVTDGKADFLNRETVTNYIETLVSESITDGGFSAKKLLSLDQEGRQIGETFVQGIVAGADESLNYENNGNLAETVGRLMHFSGEYGAIKLAYDKENIASETQEAAELAQDTVENNPVVIPIKTETATPTATPTTTTTTTQQVSTPQENISTEVSVKVKAENPEEPLQQVQSATESNPVEIATTAVLDDTEANQKLEAYKQNLSTIPSQAPEGGTDIVVNDSTANTKIQTVKTGMNSIPNANVSINVSNNASSAINTVSTELSNLNGKTATTYMRVVTKKEGAVDVNGNAHSHGTPIISSSRFNDGYLGTAYANGTWGEKADTTALTGELGQELVVRGNRFFTVGDNGAEMVHLKKGDIVFNHMQTREILSKGCVNSRGKALASGNARANNYGGFSGGLSNSSSSASSSSNNALNSNTAATTSNTKSTNKATATQTKNLKSFQKWVDKLKDWVEVRLQRRQEAIDLTLAKSENAVGYKNKNTLVGSAQNTLKSLVADNKAGYDEYLAQANQVTQEAIASKLFKSNSRKTKASQTKYAQDLVKKIQNGTIDISQYGEKVKTFIDQYSTWYDKAVACKQAIEDLNQQNIELAQTKLDNITNEYDAIISHIEHAADLLNGYIDQAETRGLMESTKYYEALTTNADERKKQLEAERAALQASFQESVKNGVIKKESVEWYNMQSIINDVSKSIQDAESDILTFADTIQTIKWERFDKLLETISRINSESEFLVKLMSEEKLFDDSGAITGQGMATLGLYGVEYNTYMAQADKYREEMEAIQKQMSEKGNEGNTKLLDRYRELEDAQRDCILSAQDQKEAMKDLISEGIDKQLEALDELIDKYKETLQAQSDLNDYQNDVAEQTKELADIQKQLAILGNDDSEENRIKKQRLENEAKEAQKELEKTQYDKYIDDQEKLLDDMREEYEDLLNARLDNIDELIRETVDTINSNAESIRKTLEDETAAVGTKLTTEMASIWGENGKGVITTYSENFSSTMTNVQITIDGIKSGIEKLISISDKQANTDVKKANEDGKQKEEEKKPTTTTTTNPTTAPTNNTNTVKDEKTSTSSTGDGKIKVGEKVKFTSGKYTATSAGGGASGNNKLGKQVYVTAINSKGSRPYHISTGKKLGKGDLGWVKKKQLSGYWTGTDFVDEDEWARINEKGQEIITLPDGSMVTPLKQGSGVINNPNTEKLLSLANDYDALQKLLDTVGVINQTKQASIMSALEKQVLNSQVVNNKSGGTYQITNEITFTLPNVTNYEEFMNKMMNDQKFERGIQYMTVGRMNGGSKLDKLKVKW